MTQLVWPVAKLVQNPAAQFGQLVCYVFGWYWLIGHTGQATVCVVLADAVPTAHGGHGVGYPALPIKLIVKLY